MKRSIIVARWTTIVLGVSLWAVANSATQAPVFSVQVLGDLPGGTATFVTGVNNANDAVGSAGEGTTACQFQCAVIWHDGTPTMLPVPGTTNTVALAINNSGVVVGYAFAAAGSPGTQTGFVWTNGIPTALPTPDPQYTDSYATAINDAGDIVGYAGNRVNLGAPVEWIGLSPLVLGPAPRCVGNGSLSLLTSISSSGTVVGYTIPANGARCPKAIATVWNDTTATLLSGGEALAVNGSGLIVGSGPTGATAWVSGIATPLQPFPGARYSTATAVNTQGIIVGTAPLYPKNPPVRTLYHALLWSSVSAAPQDLNTLISAADAKKYLLTGATAINDNCTIAVNASTKPRVTDHVALLLKPIDPSTCVNGVLAEQPSH